MLADRRGGEATTQRLSDCPTRIRVTFGGRGEEILKLKTGKVVPFGMEGNVYVLDLWIPPESAGFTRLGR